MFRAAQRRRVDLAGAWLDGRGQPVLRPHLLRRPLRAGELAQRAAQAVVQRDAPGPMLRLDVRRRAEPLRRVRQRHRAAGQPLQHQE
ncbi:MAG: hypothetical protein DMD60_12995 [Gemmatimonadetes bacterium]|nr:MAG: hypothetical protein DMD60_12995 [Gemmatimonadota bacterium]